MELKLYSIKDTLNGFTCPIPFMSEELAVRYFKIQMRENPTMKNIPEDFSLYYMGQFNPETGKIEGASEQVRVIKGEEVNGNTI